MNILVFFIFLTHCCQDFDSLDDRRDCSCRGSRLDSVSACAALLYPLQAGLLWQQRRRAEESSNGANAQVTLASFMHACGFGELSSGSHLVFWFQTSEPLFASEINHVFDMT